MKHYYKHVLTALVAATSLGACNRAEYSFRPGTGSYHAPKSSVVIQSTPAPEPVAPTEGVATATPSAPTPTRPHAAPVAPAPKAAAAPAASKLALLPRAAVAKTVSKLSQRLERKTEVARGRKGKSGVGTAAIVIGIGLVILLIGGLIGGTNFVATIGGVTFLVGLIMLIIALIKG